MKLPKELTTVTPLSKTLAAILFILLPFLGFYLGINYQKLKSFPKTATTPVDESLKQTGDEFKSLRRIKGHFDGGQFNSDVDTYMGRKHKLMLDLQTRIDSGTFNKNQIIGLLGKPNHTARKGDPLLNLIHHTPLEAESSEYLIYYWRGQHDFLYFISKDGLITGSNWWFAYE